MDQPALRIGALVRSLAGRDLGTCYVIVRLVDDRTAAVANGHQRTQERPKIKNRRHLEVLGWADPETTARLERGDKVSDAELIKVIGALRVLEEV